MLGSTLKASVATPPAPLVLEVMCMKLERLVAVQSQPKGVLMSKLPLPPAIGKTCSPGVRFSEHADALVASSIPQPPEMLPALFPLSSTK